MTLPVRLVEDENLLMYHIEISRNMLEGCHTAIVPGAPERAALIAQSLENPKKIGSHRGLDSWLGYLGKHPVLVTNTGMGGPTLEIVTQELVRLGIDTFLRVGTCGAIQPNIPSGRSSLRKPPFVWTAPVTTTRPPVSLPWRTST